MNFWGHIVKKHSTFHQRWKIEYKRVSRHVFYAPFLNKGGRGYHLGMKARRGSYSKALILKLSRITVGWQLSYTPRLCVQIGHVRVLSSFLYASYILAMETLQGEKWKVYCVGPQVIYHQVAPAESWSQYWSLKLWRWQSGRQEKFNKDIPPPTFYDIILCNTMCWRINKFHRVLPMRGSGTQAVTV